MKIQSVVLGHDQMNVALEVSDRDLGYLSDLSGENGFRSEQRQLGDANRDGRFDQHDLVAALRTACYRADDVFERC